MVKRYQKVCRTCEELYRTNQKYSIKCDKCKKIKSSFSKASIHKQEKKLERKKDKDWVKELE